MIKGVCVVIPAYEEEERIGKVVERVKKIKGIQEVVVVDDGSGDRTGEVARKAGATVLTHARNQGKGKALLTGFRYALQKNYSGVITMDGDGQHLPEEIPRFLKIRKEADIVVGCRMANPYDMPRIRYFTNLLTSFLTSLLAGRRIRDSQSGFRWIARKVLEELRLEAGRFDIESELLIKAGKKGFRIKEIPITSVYLPDSVKKSKISPLRDTLRFLSLIWRNI